MTLTLNVAAGLVGVALTVAVVLVVAALRRPQPDLRWALENLSSRPVATSATADPATWVERLGLWVMTRLGTSPSRGQQAQLSLRGISSLEFFGWRLVWALVGAGIPIMMMVTVVIVGMVPPLLVTPVVVIVGAAAGWVWPAIQLRRQSGATVDDSGEALQVLIDLIVLERLANAAAVDAITRAAFVSNNALFVQVQQALNRAALENVQPWHELQSLAESINLPQLADVVSIAQLQSEGASMSGPLRARVSELRNAYLLRMKEQAVRINQRMEVIQMIPVLSIMLVVIAAPMLGLLAT